MSVEEQIIKCEENLMDAMKVGNIVAFDELLHDDLIFIIPTGDVITKSIDIENYWSGIMKVDDIKVINRNIKLIQKCAIVVQTIHLKAKYNGQIIDSKFKYLRVWKTFDTKWKVITGSSTLIQA